MGDFVYMKVSDDKYELPIAIANSASELARILGIKTEVIYSAMSHARKHGYRTSYLKVAIGDEE